MSITTIFKERRRPKDSDKYSAGLIYYSFQKFFFIFPTSNQLRAIVLYVMLNQLDFQSIRFWSDVN
jgi:hypothetical protein